MYQYAISHLCEEVGDRINAGDAVVGNLDLHRTRGWHFGSLFSVAEIRAREIDKFQKPQQSQ